MSDAKKLPAEANAPLIPTSPEKPGSKGGKVAALTVLGVAALAGVSYVVAHQMSTGKVPQGTSVAGIEIGGLAVAEASAELEDRFSERAETPVDLTYGDEAAESVVPAQVGISFDAAATLEQAGASSSWSPSRLWQYYTAGDDLEPVVNVDEDSFNAWVDALDDEHGTKVREGKVSFEGAEVITRAPRVGEVAERTSAEDAVVAAVAEGAQSVQVNVVQTLPEVDEADVAQAKNEFANPAVSDAVSLTSGDVTVRLQPSQYTPALSMVAQDGVLEPRLSMKKLSPVLSEALEGNGGPVEATVVLTAGKPQVVADKPGVEFVDDSVEEIFLDLVAGGPDERQAEVETRPATSEFTTADAKNLNIKERVSTFETYFPYANYRNVNIGRAAELIDGTVLKPGETFSMNDVVGERTAANGFTTGIMIADGVFREDFGGGVSQMATTLFNAMFFAGLEDVEHKPHSFYISRYPVGREATVAWGSVDLRFRNDTDHGVLVEAKVVPSTTSSQGVVRVSMWSTKVWDITSSTSGRYAFTSPQTRTLSGPTCMPNSGYGGFDVDVTRYFHKPGSRAVVKSEVFHTTYTPSDTVICN